jgi:hypothetical protein
MSNIQLHSLQPTSINGAIHQRPWFQVDGQLKAFESVKAAVYAQGFSTAAFLWAVDTEKHLYALDSWKPDFRQLSFDVSPKLQAWRGEWALSQVILTPVEELVESKRWSQHPLTSVISEVDGLSSVVEPFEVFKGLIDWQKLKERGHLKAEHWPRYNRIVEQLRQLDTHQTVDHELMAFLMGMSYGHKMLFTRSFSTSRAYWG